MAKTIWHEQAKMSACTYIKIAPSQVGMFRFLLEAYDNLALFTVLDKFQAILKVFYSPHQEKEALERLRDMQSLVEFEFLCEQMDSHVSPLE